MLPVAIELLRNIKERNIKINGKHLHRLNAKNAENNINLNMVRRELFIVRQHAKKGMKEEEKIIVIAHI